MARQSFKQRALAHIVLAQFGATRPRTSTDTSSLDELPEEVPDDIRAAAKFLVGSPEEQATRILGQIERLPMMQRRVMLLMKTECTSLDELAAFLKVSVDSAREQYAFALSLLSREASLHWAQLENEWKRDSAKQFAWRRIQNYVSRLQESRPSGSALVAED